MSEQCDWRETVSQQKQVLCFIDPSHNKAVWIVSYDPEHEMPYAERTCGARFVYAEKVTVEDVRR